MNSLLSGRGSTFTTLVCLAIFYGGLGDWPLLSLIYITKNSQSKHVIICLIWRKAADEVHRLSSDRDVRRKADMADLADIADTDAFPGIAKIAIWWGE